MCLTDLVWLNLVQPDSVWTEIISSVIIGLLFHRKEAAAKAAVCPPLLKFWRTAEQGPSQQE